MDKGLPGKKLSLPRWCIGALVLILLAAAAATPTLRHQLVDAPRERAIADSLATRGARYAALVDAHILEELGALDALAADGTTLAALRTLPGSTARQQWQARAEDRLGDPLQLFLLDGDPGTFPDALAGNYIAEALYEAALGGEAPPPRAARIGEWGIYMVRPVRDGDEVAGALLMATALDPIRASLVAASDGLDNVALIQRVAPGREGELIVLGPEKSGAGSLSTPTQVPDWILRLGTTKPLLASLPRPTILHGASLIGLWSLALLLCALLLRANLRFQGPVQGSPKPRIDPRDDLFTEHYIREATSFIAPLPPSAPTPAPPPPPPEPSYRFPRRVFRDYDIRGRAGDEIDDAFAAALGKVLGTLALEQGEDTLAVGVDGRTSSPALGAALIDGIVASGCDVIDIGTVPTPVLNFALQPPGETHSGVMVTASHNPAEDNGFKIIINNHVLSSNEILDLHTRMEEQTALSGAGDATGRDVTAAYLDAIIRDILPPGGLRIVVDCGNGVTGLVAPDLFRRLDCEVIELHCEVDGRFPNHAPDPTIAANLAELISAVTTQGADLGLAFDGDGDRLVAVTGSGRIVWPDELLMIFVKDILTRFPGADVVFDVKCSRRLQNLVSSHGGRPVMWKTGHAHMRNKIAEAGAPVGGEFSGHLFFNDRWHGFDDGLYAAARLLEIIGLREQSLDDIVATFPATVATQEIKVAVSDEEKFAFVEALRLAGNFGDGAIIAIDGIRVEYPDGWGLIRASNTAPALTLRFEADSQEALQRIQGIFKAQLHKLDQHLSLDF